MTLYAVVDIPVVLCRCIPYHWYPYYAVVSHIIDVPVYYLPAVVICTLCHIIDTPVILLISLLYYAAVSHIID